MKKTFGPKRKKVTEDWRKVHKWKLHDLYSSPEVRMIRSRRMRWLEHVAHVVEKKNACKVVMGNLKETKHLKNLGTKRIILKWMLNKHNGRTRTGFVWPRIWGSENLFSML